MEREARFKEELFRKPGRAGGRFACVCVLLLAFACVCLRWRAFARTFACMGLLLRAFACVLLWPKAIGKSMNKNM